MMLREREIFIPELPEEPPYSWTWEEILEIRERPQPRILPKPEQIEQVLAFLETMRRRPRLLFGFGSLIEGYCQLAMVHQGFHWAGYITGPPDHWDIARERGWERRSTGYWEDMEEQGYTQDEMMHETLVIEIELWRRLLKRGQLEEENNG